jgi:hypothetical protein
MSKKYEITIKYIDGMVETTTITTDDIKWSLDQFIRNRKIFNELNVELKENGKEKESLSK